MKLIRGFYGDEEEANQGKYPAQALGAQKRRNSARGAYSSAAGWHVVAVRQEPVTLSRALGEAAVVEPAAESPALTETTVVRRRRRV